MKQTTCDVCGALIEKCPKTDRVKHGLSCDGWWRLDVMCAKIAPDGRRMTRKAKNGELPLLHRMDLCDSCIRRYCEMIVAESQSNKRTEKYGK